MFSFPGVNSQASFHLFWTLTCLSNGETWDRKQVSEGCALDPECNFWVEVKTRGEARADILIDFSRS